MYFGDLEKGPGPGDNILVRHSFLDVLFPRGWALKRYDLTAGAKVS
jgi:hypothetical protein